jgi:sporulation protein YlmC with PRC-barrel domain
MDLIRDVLDKRIVDRNGRDVGRVDRLVLCADERGQPRLVAIDVGPAVLADRMAPFLGRLVAGLEHAFGIDAGRPFRIPIGGVSSFDDHVAIDVAVGETPAARVEHRLRRWIGSIPGSS